MSDLDNARTDRLSRAATLLMAATALTFTASAEAADLPARMATKAPVAVAPIFSWTGLYVGGHVGGAGVSEDGALIAAPPPLLFPLGTVIGSSGSGIIGGAQIGYNWQVNRLVFGVEGDFSFSGVNASVTTPSTLIPGAVNTVTADYNWFATLTSRVGYTVDRWMLYAKGGVAFMNVDYGGNATIGGANFIVNRTSDTRSGWTLGVGVEHAFSGNWSWKLEYNYMNFGTERYNTSTTPFVGVSTTDIDTDTHAVKLGVNYRFGAAPIIARY